MIKAAQFTPPPQQSQVKSRNKGYFRSALTFSIPTTLAQTAITITANKGISAVSQSLNTKEAEQLFSTAHEALKTTGLKEKGVEILEGLSSCFVPSTKQISVLGTQKLAVFHEIGHALNNTKPILKNTIQKYYSKQMGPMIAGFIVSLSLLNKRKTTDEPAKEKGIKGKIQQGADFIKRNAGKLAFASMVPVLIEEGLASIKGQNVAKTFVNAGKLSPEIFKKMKLSNAIGFASYLGMAITLTLGAKAAVKVKDKIQADYENGLQKK